MKCIRCSTDSKYKERSNKKCPKCGGEFAFEPQSGDKLTDGAFKAAIDAVSSNSGVRWGVENLYYEVCRRITGKTTSPPMGCVVISGISAGIGVLAAVKSSDAGFLFLVVPLAVLGLITWYAKSSTRTVPITTDTFNTMWSRWKAVHGDPGGYIVRNPQHTPPRIMESDLGDYSFDRAVICDRARTVDLLLANNFHFENNCAILSIDGYPAGPFETVRAMLKRNSKLQVFALHDATPSGCELAHRLAHDPQWFAGTIKVVDVGLRPGHAKPFNGCMLKQSRPVATTAAISQTEAEWLAKYSLELAAIRPEQVLKRLFRAINNKFNPNETDSGSSTTSGDGGGYYYDSDSFSSDSSDSDGGADSFG
jgi:hypothetical protein